jgi:hypothetical protein
MKDSDKSTGPIAAIPPTDLERLRESVPIFASTLAKSAGKLFEDLDPQTSEVPSDDLSHIHVREKIPPVASLPTKMSSSMSPRFPDKFARSPYFNSWKGPKDDDDRKLAEDIFGDDSKPPAVTKQPPPPRSPITFQAHEIHLSAETVKPPASDMENDVVDKLNQQIAFKQAQLEKLQLSIKSLTQDPADDKDVEMTDGSFTLVKHKQSPARSKTLQNPTPTLPIPSGTLAPQQSNNRDPLTELSQ